MNVVVFSKDRACQLDLLLRAYRHCLGEPLPICLTRATNEKYADGYELLKRRFPHLRYITRTALKADLLQAIDANDRMTLFLTDDTVVVRPFSLTGETVEKFYERPDALCLSLRLHPGIDECYALGISTPPPRFDDELCFSWRGSLGDWCYPMSVESHIFRTGEIVPLLESYRYSTPNELEGALASRPLPHPSMMCVPLPIMVNIPQNTTQAGKNRTVPGGRTIAELNERYLAGNRISMRPLLDYAGNSCCRELIYEFDE